MEYKILAILSFFFVFFFFPTNLCSQLPERSVLTQKAKKEIINKVSQLLLDNYVYPDTAKLMSDCILKKWSSGNYNAIVDPVQLSSALNSDISKIVIDKHFQIMYNPGLETNLLSNNDALPREAPRTGYANNNWGVRTVRILNGNIGYLDLAGLGDMNSQSREAVRSSLLLMANTNAIIFDLRNNVGGSAEMVQYICSYFFDKPTHLIDIYSRPANRSDSFWTKPDSLEKRFCTKPLFILIGSGTFSAAEEFAYDMKNLKRATLVGETTPGAAHGTFERSATNGMVVYIPYSRTINAITKTDWEKAGVDPDIHISADKALGIAQEKIFENFLKEATDSASRFSLDWQYAILKSLNNPVTINEKTLKEFSGVYDDRTFTVENGELYYQRIGKPKYKLSPMTSTIMRGNDFFKIEFIKGPDGTYNNIIAYYWDRRIEHSKRSE